MAKQIDVYRQWLGIADPGPPFTHYQLLKLSQFEDDAEKVRASYRKLNAHVRKFSTGEFGPQSQALLNELAKAMLCLTDADRKAEYDAVLGRKTSAQPGGRRTMEQILLSQRSITPEQLAKARDFSKAIGMEIRDALLQQRTAAPDVVMQAYAESVGRPYLDLADLEIDPELVDQLPAALARQHSCVPVMADEDRVLVASPLPMNPDVEDDLRLRFGRPARSVFCTKTSLDVALAKYYSGQPGRAAPPKPAAAKQPAKQPAAKPAKPAKKAARAKDADDDAVELTPEERKKRKLVIVGIALSSSLLLFMIYMYARILFG
jgi:hypothetical protein